MVSVFYALIIYQTYILLSQILYLIKLLNLIDNLSEDSNIKSNEIKVFKSNKLTEQIKIFFEKMIAKETKYHLLKRLGYDIYILEKK